MITIDEMHKVPGIYVIQGRSSCFLVEIDSSRKCHQLELQTLKRDGVLHRDGWHEPWTLRIIGPLGRPGAELSDDVIKGAALKFAHAGTDANYAFRAGAKWAREQLR